MNHKRSFMVLTAAATILAACSDSSGPNGEARVYIARSASVTATQIEPAAQSMGSIPVSAVDSINIVLTSIEAINTSDTAGGRSIALTGVGTHSINLMKLSSLATDSTLLARGELTAGTYNNVRLRFSSATIRLNTAVSVGNVNYPAGTYDLTIPSGLSSGIKVQGASFTVADDASTSITLTFDPATTVGTIVATGSNKLMMSPVLHVRARTD